MIKYSEIKQLMPLGSYEISISLNFIETWLRDAEEDYGLELNPDFQRGHGATCF